MSNAANTKGLTARICCPACQGEGRFIGQTYRGSLDVDTSTECETCDGAGDVDVERLDFPMLVAAYVRTLSDSEFVAFAIQLGCEGDDDILTGHDRSWSKIPPALHARIAAAVDAHFNA